jgi:hypothetical protein
MPAHEANANAFMSNSRDGHGPRGIVITLGQAGTADSETTHSKKWLRLSDGTSNSFAPTGTCSTLWASCAARGYGLTGIAAHGRGSTRILPVLIAVRGADRPIVAPADRGAGYTGGRRRSAHAQSRSCQATRAMGAFPAAPHRGRSKFATKSRPAAWQMLKDRRVKDEILRPRFWPRYCRLSIAGSKTGNLESLLTRSHRNCDSNCNFRWADRDTCHGARPARGVGRDRRPSARRTPEDRVGREAAMKPSRRTDPLHILLWIVVVLFWIGAIGSRHSAHLALLQ